jgi:hydroxymethylpyrimidine/phosphomethylpyrimidine kinase
LSPIPSPPAASASPSSQSPQILLSIAGHDPSSGAGITADLQTFAAHGCFGTSAITALTVQSTLGVSAIHPVSPGILRATLARLCADLPPAGIKIGMLGSAQVVETVASFLKQGIKPDAAHFGQFETNPLRSVVLDPILRASSGASLLEHASLEILHQHLLPLITWITPNWAELSALTNLPIETLAQAEAATHTLAARHPHLHIVATAGDQSNPTDLLRLLSGAIHRFTGEHIATTSTHGTGCAFSSALLSRLVLGDNPVAAVQAAKRYVAEALRRAPGLGHGRGPLNLLWARSLS